MRAHGGDVKPFIRHLSGQTQGKRFESDKRSYYRWLNGGRPTDESLPRLTRWARKVGKPDNYFTSAEVPNRQQALALETQLRETQTHLAALEARADSERRDLVQLVAELTQRVGRLEAGASKARGSG